MSREEVKKILSIITYYFPNFSAGTEVAGMKPTDLWHRVIGDMEYGKALEAVEACTQECRFPPTVADIRERYNAILAAEKKETGKIRECYLNARSFYPKCGEVNHGWTDFEARTRTAERAERLWHLIDRYVIYCDSNGDECMDFAECIRTIDGFRDGVPYFRAV